MNNTLLKYIKEQRKLGISDMPIMQSLIDQGWAEQDVLDAMRDDRSFPKPPLINISLTPAQKKIAILVGGGAFCCITIIIVFVVLLWKPGSNKPTGKTDEKKKSVEKKGSDTTTRNSNNITPTKNEGNKEYPPGSTVLFTREKYRGDKRIKFYDSIGQKLISVLDENKFGTVSAITISPWSPDGKYAFFQIVERNEDYQNTTYKTYLYDSSKRATREITIYKERREENESDLVSELRDVYAFTKKRWYDNTHLILSIYEVADGKREYITMGVDGKLETFNIEGEPKLLDTSFNTSDSVFNDVLAFQIDMSSMDTETFNWKYKVLINNAVLPFTMTELPIGIKGESIIALNQPKINFMKTADPEFIRQVEQLRSEGKSELEIYDAVKDQLLPTTPASISYISAGSGSIITNMELEDKSVYFLYGIYAQKTNMIYLFNIDNGLMPKIERGLQFNPLTKELKLLYERKASKNFNVFGTMHTLGTSYQIDAENDFLYTLVLRAEEERQDPEIPEYPVTVTNLKTLETSEICDAQCSNLTVYNPYQIK